MTEFWTATGEPSGGRHTGRCWPYDTAAGLNHPANDTVATDTVATDAAVNGATTAGARS